MREEENINVQECLRINSITKLDQTKEKGLEGGCVYVCILYHKFIIIITKGGWVSQGGVGGREMRKYQLEVTLSMQSIDGFLLLLLLLLF